MCDNIKQCPEPPSLELSNLSRNKGIKILHQNIRGLFNKIPDIQIIFHDLTKKNRIKGPDASVAMFISNTLNLAKKI